jgi:hypothetical protein
MSFDNLDDIKKLRGGTMRFTFKDQAFVGIIDDIDYVPLGPGGINVRLVSLEPVNSKYSIPDIALDFTFSCYLAEVTNRPKELIVNQLIPQEGFGNVISFHVKD